MNLSKAATEITSISKNLDALDKAVAMIRQTCERGIVPNVDHVSALQHNTALVMAYHRAVDREASSYAHMHRLKLSITGDKLFHRPGRALADVLARFNPIDELVEMVLLRTDHQTLVCQAALVCRKFHRMIVTSPSHDMKRQLFLAPDYHSRLRPIGTVPNGASYLSLSTAEDDEEDPRGTARGLYRFLAVIRAPNHDFKYPIPRIWRDMFITQPPIRSVQYIVFCKASLLGLQQSLRHDKGVTLGHLYDTVMNALATHNRFCGRDATCSWSKKCSKRDFEILFESVDPEVCIPPPVKKRKFRAIHNDTANSLSNHDVHNTACTENAPVILL